MSSLAEIFFLGIALYVLYKFIFNFFLPVVKTTRQVREQFRNMQDQARQQPGNPFTQQPGFGFGPQSRSQADMTGGAGSGSASSSGAGSKGAGARSDTMGEYIDFEEIK